MMLKVGLTGGIGSGKTVVAKIFEQLGIPVFNADAAAKAIMQKDETVVRQLTERYGRDLYDHDGRLRRSMLAQIVFNDEKERQFVNRIVHPAVGCWFRQWAQQQQAAYVLEEAAILIESGGYKNLDRLILVTAPEQVRIARVIERDGSSRKAVKSRIAGQWKEADKLPYAHFVIDNSSKQMLIPQVLSIHQKLNKATQSNPHYE